MVGKDPLVPFDHSEFASMPEYINLARKIRAFGNKLDSLDHDMSYQDYLRMLMVIGNAVGYSDGPHKDLYLDGFVRRHSPGCHASSERFSETGFDESMDPHVPKPLIPYAIKETDTGGLRAHYRCYCCGIEGTCNWSHKPWEFM